MVHGGHHPSRQEIQTGYAHEAITVLRNLTHPLSLAMVRELLDVLFDGQYSMLERTDGLPCLR